MSTVGFYIHIGVVDLGPEGETDLWAILAATPIHGGKTRLHLARRAESKTLDMPKAEADAIIAGVKGEFHWTGWVP